MSGPKKKRRLVDTKEHATRARVAGFLRELGDRIESGSVVLRQGEEEVTTELPDALVLEISLDEKDKGERGLKKSLEVEVEWYEGPGWNQISLG